jgi:hypothetical protein
MFADHNFLLPWLGFEAPGNKKSRGRLSAPRLLKDLVFGLGSFKSRGAAIAPKIIIAKKVGAGLPKLHVFDLDSLTTMHVNHQACRVKKFFRI